MKKLANKEISRKVPQKLANKESSREVPKIAKVEKQ